MYNACNSAATAWSKIDSVQESLTGGRISSSVADYVADPDDFLPDPDSDLNKFSDKFLLDMFLPKICSKKYIYEPKI
jgi:hypothetical protein